MIFGFHLSDYAWFNSLRYHTPSPGTKPGTRPFLHSRGWGIAPRGLVPEVRGKGKYKTSSRSISYPDLTLPYTGDLGTRLLLVLRVKLVNFRLTTKGTKGEIGEKSCVVLLRSVDMA